jgi:hypothetical protein
VTLTLPPQKPDDPRGWLCFELPLPEPFQSYEDATQHRDYFHSPRTRPATDTERTLLAALGYELPDELTTYVRWIGPLRQRRWPQLETTDGN